MNFLPILLTCAGIVTCVYSYGIPAADAYQNVCAHPQDIAPCTCFNDPKTNRLTARCSDFTNSYALKTIFDLNPKWNIQDIWIDRCVMPFLPAKMLEEGHFQSLNVSSTTLISLFDKVPAKTQVTKFYLWDVKILRGFRWKELANTNLLEFKASGLPIRSLGDEFRDYFPKRVEKLKLDRTGITSIKDQAFSQLQNLEILEIRYGSLKKLSKDWFRRPSIISFLDFSYHKIAALPEDFFVHFPKLSYFLIGGNLLSTLPEKVFTKHRVFYAFFDNPIICDCNIKWIVNTIRPTLMNGRCAEPYSLKGRLLKTLEENNFKHCI